MSVAHQISARLKAEDTAVVKRNRNLYQIGVNGDAVLHVTEIDGQHVFKAGVVAFLHAAVSALFQKNGGAFDGVLGRQRGILYRARIRHAVDQPAQARDVDADAGSIGKAVAFNGVAALIRQGKAFFRQSAEGCGRGARLRFADSFFAFEHGRAQLVEMLGKRTVIDQSRILGELLLYRVEIVGQRAGVLPRSQLIGQCAGIQPSFEQRQLIGQVLCGLAERIKGFFLFG